MRDGDNKFYLLQRCSGRDSAENRFTTKLEQSVVYIIVSLVNALRMRSQKTPLIKPRCNLAIIICQQFIIDIRLSIYRQQASFTS